MSNIEFEPPVTRVIKQFSAKDEEFRIPADLPDLAFLRRLSIQGRLRYFQADNGDDISFTPAEGETFFFGGAGFGNEASAALADFVIANDSTPREHIIVDRTLTGANYSHASMKMDSLVGNGSKAFTITATGAGATSNMWGWVENTSRIRDRAI